MELAGSVALVTGANRGLGRHFALALREAGAAKVYAGARDPRSVRDDGLVPVALDVTDPSAIAGAARRLSDVSIIINNAGIAEGASPLHDGALDAARHELEVNYLAPMAIARAFAPALRANGGGAIVNMLSALSWLAMPPVGTYSASKAAAWSMTNSLRVLLRPQGTLVVGVHAGFIDTEMAAAVAAPKVAPEDVAAATIAALRAGEEEVLADDTSRRVKSALSGDLRLLYPVEPQPEGAAAV